jgi:hypothetical protein
MLLDNEGVEVDAGYKGNNSLKNPQVNVSRIQCCQKNQVRGSHENVNGRLKVFNVPNDLFQHLKPREKMMEKHGWCFHAIAVITQLKVEAGELCNVHYDAVYY